MKKDFSVKLSIGYLLFLTAIFLYVEPVFTGILLAILGAGAALSRLFFYAIEDRGDW